MASRPERCRRIAIAVSGPRRSTTWSISAAPAAFSRVGVQQSFPFCRYAIR
ncbi:hypothetical protein OEB99_17850 [Actinotalea sp. M2MS4P-6]|uniref:hypothetical protein n=1 Tax=Actinotalea sp. M2MS4P-6 TaxID=2983762 RepID=UPI0021E39B91|nr:hypothetical protein [Actinotalea sp. M2MS4P-6]MCV2396178.1 hypothetical protein [Actinotalea sp. M2MS4P-6]